MTEPFDISGMTGIFDTPEMRRQRLFDTLGGIGLAMIQASAPGGPKDFGSIVAHGLAGGAAAARGAEDKYLKRAMVGAQVAKAKSDIENDNAWKGLWGGAAPAAQEAPAVASPALAAAGPTNPGSGPNPFNIGNVRPVGGGPNSGFQQPTSLNDGIMLAVNNARAYPGAFNNGQPMTLTQIGERWAPKGDGKNDPLQWAKNVASISGLSVDQPIDLANPNTAALFARGVHGAEWGQSAVKPIELYHAALAAGGRMPGAAVPQGSGDTPRVLPGAPADGSGTPLPPPPAGAPNPVHLAQYQPGQQPGAAPYKPPEFKSFQDVVNNIPPGVRPVIQAMGRKEGMAYILKNYVEPGHEAVIHTPSGQVVFAPKTQIGRDPNLAPLQGADLDIKRQQLNLDKRRTESTINNAEVTTGPDGQPRVNETLLNARRGVAAAQGTDPAAKITVELAQDGIKRNNEWQTAGLKAQSSIGRLGALQSMLDQISTNRFKGTVTDIKAAAKAVGIDLEAMGVKDDVGVTQAAQALTNLLALENRDPSSGAGMPGAMSDADRQYLQQASVSITKDPAGNRILIAVKKGDLQRQVDIAKYAREYIKSPEFKTNPAGLDDYINEKISAKDYYDRSVLPQQSIAPPGAIPPPPSGYTIPGQADESGKARVPAPPSGFRIIQ